MFNGDHTIRAVDPALWDAIQAENDRQHNPASQKGMQILADQLIDNIEAFVAI